MKRRCKKIRSIVYMLGRYGDWDYRNLGKRLLFQARLIERPKRFRFRNLEFLVSSLKPF